MDKIFKSRFWFPPPQHLELCFYWSLYLNVGNLVFSPLRRMCIFKNNKYCQELRDFSTLKHLSFYTAASYFVLWVQFSSSVMSDSVRPHRQQPTRLPSPWDSPGKNTGVGCHFLLQCMKVKSESEVVPLCLTLRDPMACSPPGSSVYGIFQARVLEWGAIAFSDTDSRTQQFYC